ncbi:hypothetical protein Patl1_09835 [Pistacia atlantica]|uniref:Uncharacterized protein n=1 Tax=Pistacia atlantica TaxID=434234 RepID=A0ACC1A8P8_9ROSI|nr:hypothetical protein Patl1_09835 [Pistacia atlantica]
MVDSSMVGFLVPAVKSEQQPPSTADAPSQPMLMAAEEEAETETNKDTLCPICMEIIKDAFLTACGHSFCYMCIFTHLRNKNDCPCCGYFLTTKHIFPNLLLNKSLGARSLLKRTSAAQVAKSVSPVQHLHQALQQGCEVSVKEVDGLLALLEEKKRKMEQKEAQTNMQILHEFLYFLRKQKLEELNEIQTDLQSIKEDIHAVERHRKELHMARERCLLKRRTLDDVSAAKPGPLQIDKNSKGISSKAHNVQGRLVSSNSHNSQKNTDEMAQVSSQGVQIRDVCGVSDSQHVTQLGLPTARKRRVQAQFNDLQEYYLQKRRHWARQSHKQGGRDNSAINKEGYNPALKDFQSVLTNFTQYSRLRVIAEPRQGDLFHAANIVSSIEFDRDNELYATAGVSRRIKIFEFSSVSFGHDSLIWCRDMWN